MSLREVEAKSIRDFVQQAASEGYISGVVLDFGCGKQPYRDIVESIKPFGGPIYQAFDQAAFPANVSGEDIGKGDPLIMQGWGTILCTQVVQYVPLYPDEDGLESLLIRFRQALEDQHGHLVMTYPTNWPEVEPEDLHRFTKAGMERLLTEAGFTIVMHQRRGDPKLMVCHEEILGRRVWASEYTLGYGVVAKA